jgi:hypothetical protein
LAEEIHERWRTELDQYPEIAQYDRVFVRGIPELLASVGLQVVVRGHTETAASSEQQAVPA